MFKVKKKQVVDWLWFGYIDMCIRCYGSDIRPRVHKAFHVQDRDQAQVSNWIISGLLPIISSRKLDFCIHWQGKCFRHKMHTIKVHVGDN